MKWTFVFKEDIVETGAIAASLFSTYMSWENRDPSLLLPVIVFLGLAAYLYAKKNKARWCRTCNQLMVYGTENSSTSVDYRVVYECPKCGKKNDTGLETTYPE